MRRSIYRILDANLNRASEGLRVVEDYLRFVRDDAELGERAKTIRHELASCMRASLGSRALLAARDSVNDPGRHLTTPQETQRAGIDDVVAANVKRIQQALRSLEEWSKVEASGLSAQIEQLRYDTYDLESLISLEQSRNTRLKRASLYVLVDQEKSTEDFRSRLQALVEAQVSIIQLRLKDMDDRAALRLGMIASELTRGSSTLLIMNDRIDLALAIDADGVHLGQDDIPLAKARELMPTGALIGISTHSIDQALAAEREGADYIGVGPTFPSQTKQFDHFPGLEFVRAVASEITIPAFAIGGIEADRLAEVRQAGLSRVAVSRAIWQAPNTAVACAQFHTMLSHDAQAIQPQDSDT